MKLREDLNNFLPSKKFFIGVDSDGNVFDSMETKQKEVFFPNLLKFFRLEPIEKIAAETWYFVNLYSRSRGLNRFKALVKFFELLEERKKSGEFDITLYPTEPLKEWFKTETSLGNHRLISYAEVVKIPEIDRVLEWSLTVSEESAGLGEKIRPFPFAESVLEKAFERADIAVVSQTPTEILIHEWGKSGLDKYVRFICGQEYGSKSEQLARATKQHYPPDNVLMVGDSPGDLAAAIKIGILYYPVIPGFEEKSWKRLCNEALQLFFSGEYTLDYERKLIEEFNSCLPESPPWSR